MFKRERNKNEENERRRRRKKKGRDRLRKVLCKGGENIGRGPQDRRRGTGIYGSEYGFLSKGGGLVSGSQTGEKRGRVKA